MLAHAVVTVHPRVCGEQLGSIGDVDLTDGSSPRVRGTDADCQARHNEARFIPACAGNRFDFESIPEFEAVHPRVCGEQGGGACPSVADGGSSPRVRGTGVPGRQRHGVDRFIPACAGNSNQRDVTRSIQAVHPRVCGEQWIWQGLSENTLGSSPRVRGTDQLFRFRSVRRRFIPACAGNRYGLHQHTIQATVHPRVCGEQSQPFAPIGRPDGSSPRVRGTDRSRRDTVRLVRFIPACAGNRAQDLAIRQ